MTKEHLLLALALAGIDWQTESLDEAAETLFRFMTTIQTAGAYGVYVKTRGGERLLERAYWTESEALLYRQERDRELFERPIMGTWCDGFELVVVR